MIFADLHNRSNKLTEKPYCGSFSEYNHTFLLYTNMPVLSIMGESVDGLRNREECGILRLMRNSEFIIRNFGVRFADDNKKQDEIIIVLFFVIEISSGEARYYIPN